MSETLTAEEKNILAETELFAGILLEEIPGILNRLDAAIKKYPKESIILHAGDNTRNLGLVLSGSVRMEENDIWGRRSIIGSAGVGETFAETYACVGKEDLMVDVISSRQSRVLFFPVNRLLDVADSRLTFNLIQVLAGKNLNLTRKIRLITPKSLRERILAYLSLEARRQRGDSIELPFNRQQMADYLNADRSALSGELSRMKQEGLIDYRKNRFTLYAEGNL